MPLNFLTELSNVYSFPTIKVARYANKIVPANTRPIIIQLTNLHPGECYWPKNHDVKINGIKKPDYRNAKGEWVESDENKYT